VARPLWRATCCRPAVARATARADAPRTLQRPSGRRGARYWTVAAFKS
jgi:hypothetical protein